MRQSKDSSEPLERTALSDSRSVQCCLLRVATMQRCSPSSPLSALGRQVTVTTTYIRLLKHAKHRIETRAMASAEESGQRWTGDMASTAAAAAEAATATTTTATSR
jgi:hypothetical protein